MAEPTQRRPESLNQDRYNRFVSDLDFNEPIVETPRPFYQGSAVGERMSQIRESIMYTRQNWNQYNTMMEKLNIAIQDLMQRVQQPLREADSKLLDDVSTLKSDWENSDDSFTLLRLYCSSFGHEAIFSLSNRDIFQRDSSLSDIDRVRTMVFLIELLNIDLYKLYLKSVEKQHFFGTVYRGLCVSPNLLAEYERILNATLSERYIAVPLSLESATQSEEKAKEILSVVGLQENQKQAHWKRLLFRIHVVDLRANLLEIYTNRFPDSVVTTICAMPIGEFSQQPEQQEFLLRGAFYHVLNLTLIPADEPVDESVDGYLDAVVVNTNRDHPSTSQLGDQDKTARNLFGTLVEIVRYEFCIQYFKDRNMDEISVRYEEYLTECHQKLTGLLS